jgi:transcriptional regulator with XRE-family HTH domain
MLYCIKNGGINMALDYTIIGQRLKKARLEKNLTQEQLAEQIDVSIAFLSRIERGSSHVNLKRLTQICNVLDISEGSILNGVSEDSKQYLSSDFKEILDKATPEKQKLIYKIAELIINEE